MIAESAAVAGGDVDFMSINGFFFSVTFFFSSTVNFGQSWLWAAFLGLGKRLAFLGIAHSMLHHHLYQALALHAADTDKPFSCDAKTLKFSPELAMS